MRGFFGEPGLPGANPSHEVTYSIDDTHSGYGDEDKRWREDRRKRTEILRGCAFSPVKIASTGARRIFPATTYSNCPTRISLATDGLSRHYAGLTVRHLLEIMVSDGFVRVANPYRGAPRDRAGRRSYREWVRAGTDDWHQR